MSAWLAVLTLPQATNEGQPDAPVKLAQQCLAGAAQRCVGLGAGLVGARVLTLEVGVDPDDAQRGGEGRPRLPPGLGGWPGSDVREDLDPRRPLNTGSPRRLAQGRILGEAARLLGGGEVMGDEQLVAVLG